MKEITIIGTVPPCPRCKLLTEIVKARVKTNNLDAIVKHISYTSEEAAEVAKRHDLIPGTAKDVARAMKREIDLESMPKLSDIPKSDFQEIEPELAEFSGLFNEVQILDDWLREYELNAKESGILMTPVLIISDEILHCGSVPAVNLIDKWLSELRTDCIKHGNPAKNV